MRISTLCALAIAIFASGCVSKYQLTVDEYAAAAHRINLGDSKEQVLTILEPTQSRLDNSDRKYPVLCTRQGISVEIYYFRSGWQDDFLNTDDEYTPYVFNDEKLVAIGWEALGGPRLRSKVLSRHTALIRTTWRNMCKRSYGFYILSIQIQLLLSILKLKFLLLSFSLYTPLSSTTFYTYNLGFIFKKSIL